MRRLAFLLALLAALTGTSLRQAEAANDLARSLAEFSQDADLEAPDASAQGVGQCQRLTGRRRVERDQDPVHAGSQVGSSTRPMRSSTRAM